MFTAIVSIAGLVASAYLGRRELTRRKESGDRSGMGWGITFCIMQAFLAWRPTTSSPPSS